MIVDGCPYVCRTVDVCVMSNMMAGIISYCILHTRKWQPKMGLSQTATTNERINIQAQTQWKTKTITADGVQFSPWKMTTRWLEVVRFGRPWLTLALIWFLHSQPTTQDTIMTQWPYPVCQVGYTKNKYPLSLFK